MYLHKNWAPAFAGANHREVFLNIRETESEVVIEPAGVACSAVIWLHGLGADGHDFAPLVPELAQPKDAGIRFVFPHAPVRPITINNGMSMRGWYDIPSLSNMKKQDEAGIRDSERIVHAYLDTEITAGIPAEKIVLAGFSQGGAIALHTGTRYPKRLAGLMALSTYLPLSEKFASEVRHERTDTPILMCHGSHDPMLPMALGANSREILERQGFKVSWHEYSMAHQVCEEEIEEIGRWLRERLL